MDEYLKYRIICPVCGKAFDSREGKLAPNGKVMCHECYEHFVKTYTDTESPENSQYPNFVPKDWRDCYKLPLHLDNYYIYALCEDDEMALSSFNLKYDEDGNYLPGEQERIKHIIDVINGVCLSDFEPEWKLSDDETCAITYKGEYQFLVRGWGYLTGCGGLNLPEELAAKMQDGFINYIIDKLNGK